MTANSVAATAEPRGHHHIPTSAPVKNESQKMPTNTTHPHPHLDPPSGPPANNIPSYSPPSCPPSSSIPPVGSGGAPRVPTPESEIGTDRVSFTVEPNTVQNNPWLWDEAKYRSQASDRWARHRTATVEVGGATAHLRVYRVDGIDKARIEVNPSRVLDPDGIGLCPAEALPEVLRLVVAAFSRFVEITPDRLACARVTRLDVAVHFPGVLSPDEWITGLTRPSVTYARQRTVHFSRSGQPQTYRLGSKSTGHVIVYDKHDTHPALAPEGYLRFEVQARTPWLKTANITTLAVITPSSIHRLAQERFGWMMGRGPLAPLPSSTGPLPLVDLFLDFATGTEIVKEAS